MRNTYDYMENNKKVAYFSVELLFALFIKNVNLNKCTNYLPHNQSKSSICIIIHRYHIVLLTLLPSYYYQYFILPHTSSLNPTPLTCITSAATLFANIKANLSSIPFAIIDINAPAWLSPAPIVSFTLTVSPDTCVISTSYIIAPFTPCVTTILLFVFSYNTSNAASTVSLPVWSWCQGDC